MRDANTRGRQILDCRQRRQRIGHHVERRVERQRAKCCSYSDWGDGSGAKGWEARKGFEELGLQVRGRVHLYNTRLYGCNHLMTAMKLYNSSSHPHYRFPNIRHTSITNRKHNQTSHFNKSVRLHAPWNNLFNTVKTSQKVYKQTENAAENNSSQKNLVEDESLVILDVFKATVGFVRSLAGFLSCLVTLLSSLCLITFSASIKSSTNGKKY